MDVERIQKINAMAMNLLNQGLATDRDDAVAQAERMFRQQDSQEYSEMRETLAEVKAKPQPEQQSELSQDQIQQILKKNTEYLVKTIKGFQEKVTLLERELNGLKAKLDVHKIPSVKELVVNAQQQQKPPQPQQEQKPAQQEAHHRTGQYKEADVSVEKFFYMGSR